MKIFFLDLETTGLGRESEIFQLGGIALEEDGPVIVNEYSEPRRDSLVKGDLPWGVKKVTKMNIKKIRILAKGAREESLIPILDKYADYLWVGHNIKSFDYKIIANTYERCDKYLGEIILFDTYSFAYWVGKKGRCKLSELFEFCKNQRGHTTKDIDEIYLDMYPDAAGTAFHHNAVYDSFMCLYIYTTLIDEYNEFIRYCGTIGTNPGLSVFKNWKKDGLHLMKI